MRAPHRFLVWAVAAVAGCALLVEILRRDYARAGSRWSAVLVGNPETGRQLFQQKGCARCHVPGGTAGKQDAGPNLSPASLTGPDRLITAMWNHAPEMWQRMRAERIPYPAFSHEEMAHLFAYLYAVRSAEPLGDSTRGRALFEERGCGGCHPASPVPGQPPGLPALARLDTPVAWARAMWNHPVEEGAASGHARFAGSEMSDLVAYVQGASVTRIDPLLLKADAGRGGALFRSKSCTTCHSVKDEAGRIGPELGPGREIPPTVVLFAGSMWNHSPAMRRAMKEKGIRPPTFDDGEMAELVAFLYSFRIREPGGSPNLGEVLFAGRGCASCHGAAAEGSSRGPGLRGRGKRFTSVTLAAALWSHGPAMYQRAQEIGLDWPVLTGSDIGDLMTFLNTPPEGTR